MDGPTERLMVACTRLKFIEIKLHFHSCSDKFVQTTLQCSVVCTNLFLNNSNVHARCNYGLGGSKGTGSSVGDFLDCMTILVSV